MKKRLRKKKHLKEFTEYGLEIKFNIIEPKLDENSYQDFFWNFLDFIESYDMYFGGMCSMYEIGGVIEIGDKNPILFGKLLIEWSEQNNISISNYTSNIMDLWYPDRKITYNERLRLAAL